MVDVFDVAKYVLEKQGSMTTMKLQKLVYYSQAWSLVWDEKPLFAEEIQAWASGPVVRDLYNHHRGAYLIPDIQKGNVDNLTKEQRETIDAILEAYGDKPAQWLADLTHMEKPWNEAREGFDPGDNCENEITQASLAEYYSSLSPDCEPV
jgi:uncharacterized phage-associated protein